MKAEHRKELHTNLLADRMNRFVQGMKTGQPSTAVPLWVISILAAGTLICWFWARASDAGTTRLWLNLDRDLQSGNVPALENMAREHSGTVPGRIARFQAARMLLNVEGLPQLNGVGREAAIESVQKARDIYQQLAERCRDDKVLEQEALLGTAKAEEALIGIPEKKEDAGKDRGDLQTALKYYHRYLDATGPDNPLAQVVRKHVEELENPEAGALDFYRELNVVADREAKNKALGQTGNRAQPTTGFPSAPDMPVP